jgi:hypothetical protein
MSTGGKKEPEDIFSGLDQSPALKAGLPSGESLSTPHPLPVKLIAMIVGAIVILGVAGGAVYFLVLKPKTTTPVAVVPSAPAPTHPVGIPTTPTPIETPPPAAVAPTVPVEQPPVAATTSVGSVPVDQPVTQPPTGITLPPPTAVEAPQAAVPPTPVVTEGKDSDLDQLTDMEEPYYNADMTKSDTNGNGYLDGTEVTNLYDPSVKGNPMDKATFISHPLWGGLTFLLPKPWSILSVNGQPNQARIATGSATRIGIEWILNPEKKSFDGLLAGLGIDASHAIHTKRGYEARQTSDGLTTYIAIGDKVLKVTYDLNGDTSYDYRTSYAMIVESVMLTPVK